MAHDHHAHTAPSPGSTTTHEARVRALQIALAANGAFFGVQLAAGIAFGSLALIADSAPMASDVVPGGELTLHQALAKGEQLKVTLAERFAIEHATLELECHSGDDEDHDTGTLSRTATL